MLTGMEDTERACRAARALRRAPALDRAVEEVTSQRAYVCPHAFQREGRAARDIVLSLTKVAPAWVVAGCQAKGLARTSAARGRGVARRPDGDGAQRAAAWPSLDISPERAPRPRAHGRDALRRPARGRGVPRRRFRPRASPRLLVRRALEPGSTRSPARERQAGFYQSEDPEGGVSAGARRRQRVVDPADRRALQDVRRGQRLRAQDEPGQRVGRARSSSRRSRRSSSEASCASCYGGGDVGAYLVEHAGDRRHPHHRLGQDPRPASCGARPGPSASARKRENEPLLEKDDHLRARQRQPGDRSCPARTPTTSCGSRRATSPRWSPTTPRSTATPPRCWSRRKGGRSASAFSSCVGKALGEAPPRKAYYPGARERYERARSTGAPACRSSAQRRARTSSRGRSSPTSMPAAQTSRCSSIEPFCGDPQRRPSSATADPGRVPRRGDHVLQRAPVGHAQRGDHHRSRARERDPDDRARARPRHRRSALRHGGASTTGRRSCSARSHRRGAGTRAPRSPNIQSGLGWVHNTFMLEGIEKSVFRGPLVVSPKPAWFYDNAMMPVPRRQDDRVRSGTEPARSASDRARARCADDALAVARWAAPALLCERAPPTVTARAPAPRDTAQYGRA